MALPTPTAHPISSDSAPPRLAWSNPASEELDRMIAVARRWRPAPLSPRVWDELYGRLLREAERRERSLWRRFWSAVRFSKRS